MKYSHAVLKLNTDDSVGGELWILSILSRIAACLAFSISSWLWPLLLVTLLVSEWGVPFCCFLTVVLVLVVVVIVVVVVVVLVEEEEEEEDGGLLGEDSELPG